MFLPIFLFISLSAFAHNSDFQKIRSLLPKGQDIANVKKAELRGVKDLSALAKIASDYYIAADINKDGHTDYLVISEADPTCDSPECDRFNHNDRTINFYTGTSSGSFETKFINKGYVLRADDGGMMGDPLRKLELKKNGSITLSFFGGSADRWEKSDTFAFRDGELKVVGHDSNNYSSTLADMDVESINFITGVTITKKRKNGMSKVNTNKVQVKPSQLQSLATYKG